MLIHHVQVLQPPTIGHGIVMKTHGPDLDKVLGLMTLLGVDGRTSPPLNSGSRSLEALLPPQPVYPLVVYSPAFPTEHGGKPSVSPSGCNRLRSTRGSVGIRLAECRQHCKDVVACCGVGPPPYRRATLIPGKMAHRATKAMRRLYGHRSFPPPTHMLRQACSYKIAFSSSASTRSFLKGSAVHQLCQPLDSLACTPPYCCFQRSCRLGDLNDAANIGKSHTQVDNGSAILSLRMIYSAVWQLRFLVKSRLSLAG